MGMEPPNFKQPEKQKPDIRRHLIEAEHICIDQSTSKVKFQKVNKVFNLRSNWTKYPVGTT